VSLVEVVSLTNFESAATQFSLTISDSTWAVCSKESMPQQWKQFCWWFISRQRLSSPWLFMTQQGMSAVMNLCVTHGRTFIANFLVNTGCVRCRIHVSPSEAVSLMISESAATEFSVTISNSTRVVCAVKSTRYLWKLLHWWFLSLKRLSFHWLFLSQQGLC